MSGEGGGLSSAALVRALGVVVGEELEAPYEVLIALRQQPQLAATIYSAWREEGMALNPALAWELEVQTERNAFYRDLQRRLQRLHPSAVPMKGLEVADLYPPGLVRYMNDLDYLVDEPTLWRIARMLMDEDWRLHTASFLRIDGDLHLVLSLWFPQRDPWALPHFVELTTFAAFGDLAGVAPRVALPATCGRPAVKNLVMLLYERLEQPYRARDLVDGTVEFQAADEATLATLWLVVDELALWPECLELLDLLAAAGLPGPSPPPRRMRRRLSTRAGRLSTRAARFRRPVDGALQHLQHHLIKDRLGRFERRIWSVAQHRVPVGRALDAGLVAFGLPLDDQVATGAGDRGVGRPGPPGDGIAVLRQEGDAVWALTPVGQFLLVPGEEVLEESVRSPGGDGAV
jgi:hypothetical protein